MCATGTSARIVPSHLAVSLSASFRTHQPSTVSCARSLTAPHECPQHDSIRCSHPRAPRSIPNSTRHSQPPLEHHSFNDWTRQPFLNPPCLGWKATSTIDTNPPHTLLANGNDGHPRRTPPSHPVQWHHSPHLKKHPIPLLSAKTLKTRTGGRKS